MPRLNRRQTGLKSSCRVGQINGDSGHPGAEFDTHDTAYEVKMISFAST